MKDIWILGAAGQVGRAVAAELAARQASLVLVGRDGAILRDMAARLGGTPRIVIASSIQAIAAEIGRNPPAVVANTIGPFAATAAPIIRSCPPGSCYLDLSNELASTIGVLEFGEEAVASGQCIVTGAGWGVLATESLVLKLCKDRLPAARVRVDAAPFVDAPGPIGPTLAATIIDGLPAGGRRYQDGQLARANLGGEYRRLVLPDGSVVGTGAMPTGDLEAARRASGAPTVVSASNMAPGARLARALMSAAPLLFALRPVREFAKRRLAKVNVPAAEGPAKHSWAHAEVRWSDGSVREGWLRAGDAMNFTTAVASAVAHRLARDEGRPGAFTPGALFGPDLAVEAGGTFILA